ncbi:hypothetical protein PBCVNEJV1_787L [Paramecium bursaria Chlorella virus NE-JV-1]|nr:hypothetical protein PBCVNEJV1_787L [Paramecium bursaria Chlorella virus NE-JV-1]
MTTEEVSDLILRRFKLGRERYSRGLLHPSNDGLNYRNELIEELLDAVVYASADVVRHTPAVSVDLKISDDGGVRLGLTVNHDVEHDDGADAIHAKILECMTKTYDYTRPDSRYHVLSLCIFVLCGVLREHAVK